MVVTQFGRVEFDPMRVPTAASMARPPEAQSFAAELDARSREVPRPAAAKPAAPAAETHEEPAAPAHEPAEAAAEPEPRDPAATDGDDTPPIVAATPFDQPSSGGEPDRRITADEGAGAPLESRPVRSGRAPVTIDAAAVRSEGRVAFAAAMPATLSGNQTAPAAPTANNAKITGTAATASLRAATAKATVAGYRTLTPQALQHDEAARDSVFKQILFKLGKGGGEMRLRLDPPELGELDLHLLVENGNQVRLSIGAERADLRQLLEQGLPELQQRLAATGLQIAHAEVHDRQRGNSARDGAPTDQRAATAALDNHDEPAAAATARGGWYSTQGLDFWV